VRVESRTGDAGKEEFKNKDSTYNAKAENRKGRRGEKPYSGGDEHWQEVQNIVKGKHSKTKGWGGP